MKKTVLKIVLAICLVLAMAVGLASCGGTSSKLPDADSKSGAIDGTQITWDYNKDNNTLRINGTGDIPDSASADAVWWYDVRHSVKKLEIAEGITAIGDYAFYYFPSLESVNIPAAVTRLGKCAFAFNTSLKTISLPDTITSVGEACFESCKALTDIYVPASVTSIGSRAFAYCSSLKNVRIMAKVSEIKSETFAYCKALESISFHESVKAATVAADAFKEAKIDFSAAKFTALDTGEVTLTIEYVGPDGTIVDSRVFKPGESYAVETPEIGGYTPDKAIVQGVILEDTKVVVTYTAVVADAPPAEQPAQDSQSSTDTQPAADEEKEGIEVGTIIAIVIFAIVIVAIVVLAVIMMRSDKKQAGKNNKNTGNKRK